MLPILIAATALTVTDPSDAQPLAAQPPNIVLVFVDDMGWADFSCFGSTGPKTQHIDQLAEEGIRFERFYVNSPICSPSRVAISTGQYPQRWKVTSYLAHRKLNQKRGMAQWLDPKAPMLARSLQKAGYSTGHFGKWHMGGQRDVGEAPLITEYGFDASLTNFEGLGDRLLPLCDAYDGSPLKRHALGSDKLGRGHIEWVDRSQVTAGFVNRAVEFIDECQTQNKPFYLNLWPDDVHSPYYPPEVRRGDTERRTLYHGVLDTMDEQLGVLFDRIRNDDQLNSRTLILICSDNGPDINAGSAGPLRGLKTMLYEGGIRSSLIAWGPGILNSERRGAVDRKSLFCAIDLVPTLLQLAGQPVAADFDGEQLAEVLTGQQERSRSQPIFFRRPPDRNSFYGVKDLPDLAVVTPDWKLVCDYDGSDPELYDLARDVAETTNVASRNVNVTNGLKRQLLEWHADMPADNGADFVPAKR